MAKAERIPNNYDVSVEPEQLSLSVVDDSEFSNFVAGQSEQLSPSMKKKVKLAMKDAGSKLNIFFVALAQKNANRLSRIMGALDGVDNELLQPWRIKTMNTEELMDLFSELNVEKHRTTKGLMDMAGKFDGDLVTHKFLTDDDGTDTATNNLSTHSKKRVLDFYKQKVAV